MKKTVSLVLALSLLLTLAAPSLAEDKHEITSQTFPFIQRGIMLGDLPLYFLDGVADLPYVEGNDLSNLIHFFLGSPTGEYTFTNKIEGAVVTVTREHPAPGAMDNGAYMAIDFDANTITFSDHDLFCLKNTSISLLDITDANPFNAAGEPAVLQKVEKNSMDRYGEELIIRACDYGIDFVQQDDKYLIPLQTLADFIASPTRYQNVFFNGQAMIVAQTISGDEQYYAAPAAERSAALTEYGYNELCMMLDYCYGLKDAHGIESFAKLFHTGALDQLLKETSAYNADLALSAMIWNYLDDGHSAFLASSYLAGNVKYDTPIGASTGRMLTESERYTEARKKYYPDGVPGYEEVGNTAYITFDKFFFEYPTDMDAYYRVEDVNDFGDVDTIGLIMKAHAQITRENSPIENVVIDLSLNDGGMVDSAVFVLAWLLGEASIAVKNTMTGSMSTATYRCDANRDRQFDEKDTVADKNIYCLISANSFSCGNLVPSVLKDSHKATLLGRTSGGGSCVVQYASSAWGTSFRISSPKRMSFLKNGSFYDIDRGTEPDYQISKPEKYYDRQALTDYINSLY